MSKIHFESSGTGRTIILVHGWAMHSGIWRRFAEQLAASYKVICIDLPGHGHSERIAPFTLESVSDALLDALPVEKCCWLGWSLGAEIVIEIARRRPERVESLILLAGSPCFTKKPGWPGMAEPVLTSFANSLKVDSRATLLNFLTLQTRGLADQKTVLRELKSAIFENPVPDAETLCDGLDVLQQTDLRAAFAGLNMPVAALLGELDMLVPVAVGAEMQKLLPKLDLTILKRAGHVPFLSHNPDLLAAIHDFMDKHNAG